VIWYFGAGRSEATYIKGRYGKDYPRRAWGKPLLIATFGLVVYFVLGSLVVAAIALVRRG